MNYNKCKIPKFVYTNGRIVEINELKKLFDNNDKTVIDLFKKYADKEYLAEDKPKAARPKESNNRVNKSWVKYDAEMAQAINDFKLLLKSYKTNSYNKIYSELNDNSVGKYIFKIVKGFYEDVEREKKTESKVHITHEIPKCPVKGIFDTPYGINDVIYPVYCNNEDTCDFAKINIPNRTREAYYIKRKNNKVQN